MKERELLYYEQRVLELKKSIEKDSSNNLCNYKYNLIHIRYKQLKETLKNLKQLELELNTLIFFLGLFIYELF